MVNLNKVFLVGNLTRDPELRYTPQGTAVVNLRIAVNSPYKDKNGEAKQDTCFINVVAWGQMAEVCNQYLQKGRAVFVEGRLQSRSWQDNQGNKRNTIDVRASRVQFMPFGKNNRDNGTANMENQNSPEEIILDEEQMGESV